MDGPAPSQTASKTCACGMPRFFLTQHSILPCPPQSAPLPYSPPTPFPCALALPPPSSKQWGAGWQRSALALRQSYSHPEPGAIGMPGANSAKPFLAGITCDGSILAKITCGIRSCGHTNSLWCYHEQRVVPAVILSWISCLCISKVYT